MNLKTEPSRKNAQQVEKMQVRTLIGKDSSSFRSVVDHVVPPIFNVEPQRSGHDQENRFATGERSVKCFRLTP
jgi:hypothetical protein